MRVDDMAAPRPVNPNYPVYLGTSDDTEPMHVGYGTLLSDETVVDIRLLPDLDPQIALQVRTLQDRRTR